MDKKFLPQALTSPFNELEEATPFISSKREKRLFSQSTHLLGFCYDGTTSFRPGARFGPNAIREVSLNLETYSPYLHADLEEGNLIDLGNLPFYPAKPQLSLQYFEKMLEGRSLDQEKIRLVVLGGEHSISYGPIKAHLDAYPDLVLLHLDAHADLRDGYLGEKFSHASIIRRVLDHFGPRHELIQYGIRSGTREEFEWMRSQKTLKTSLQDLVEHLQALDSQRPIYLTLDLDYFDPAYFPGTGTPETGGEDFHSFIKIIKILRQKNLVGADVNELAPHYDPTGNSSCFASKVVREVILSLNMCTKVGKMTGDFK